ncbi:uncharacterized protein TNCT_330371 [Trichonephila clavata]|uniref:Uncharacterized protein n=1 Tax=Trichonephila clavata TaxID=2740835 RepID=A0A8X6IZA8_TRICU|nr:uncharacterized protein TNCT_330371 [Trichonephila clavata]
MDYRCDPCNLDFTDIQQYLDHDCKFYVDQSVTQVYKDISMCINAFNLFKSTREGHAGNTPANEEQNKGISNDASVKEKRLILDFLKCNENKNQESNLNQPSTAFGVVQISEKNAQNRSKPPGISPELSPIPLCISERKPYFNPNQQSVAAKGYQMNPQIKANEQAIEIVHESKSTMYRIPHPSHRILSEMDLNLGKYSKRNRRTVDFVNRSKGVCEEPKYRHNVCSFQRNVNITLKTQNEIDTQSKIAASNSSLMKCSSVYSKETPIEQNIPGRSLNKKKEGN